MAKEKKNILKVIGLILISIKKIFIFPKLKVASKDIDV